MQAKVTRRKDNQDDCIQSHININKDPDILPSVSTKCSGSVDVNKLTKTDDSHINVSPVYYC